MGYLRTRPLRKKNCPDCAQPTGCVIQYGNLDERSLLLIQDGTVKYGGPIKPDQAPDRFCKSCGHSWIETKQYEVQE